MDDPGQQLLEALDALNAVADAVTADEAAEELDAATLQVFWRDWPAASSWAGALWRTLNAELAAAATPSTGDDRDEMGGG